MFFLSRLREVQKEKERDERGVRSEYLQLSLPRNCVHFVNDAASLKRCRARLTQVCVCVCACVLCV